MISYRIPRHVVALQLLLARRYKRLGGRTVVRVNEPQLLNITVTITITSLQQISSRASIMDVPVAANVLGTLGAVCIVWTWKVIVLTKTGLLVRSGIYTS